MKKILVCAAVVPDTLSVARLENNRLVVSNNSLIINPLDELCINRALQIREECKQEDVEITVASVGMEIVEDALRKAAALGVSRIVRINTSPVDAWSVAAELAAFIVKDRYDLILCGYQSWDYSFGLVPYYLAVRLELPLIESCISIGLEENIIRARRETLDGYDQVELDGQAIAACKKNIVAQRDVRIPTFRGMMTSKSFPIEIISPVNESPRLLVKNYIKPPQRDKVEFISIEKLADLVREEMKKGKQEKRSDSLHPVYAGQWLMDYNYEQFVQPDLTVNKRIRVKEHHAEPDHIGLDTSRIIISGGMGMGSLDNWRELEEFSRITNAALACTKPVYDRGWRPYYEHVGQTGHKVSPDLYLAVGISGALQHIAGMFRSKSVVAINNDPNAPIFKEADYGIIGDAVRVMQTLNRLLRLN